MLHLTPCLREPTSQNGKAQVEFILGLLDLDLAFHNDKPTDLTSTSTPDEQALYKT